MTPRSDQIFTRILTSSRLILILFGFGTLIAVSSLPFIQQSNRVNDLVNADNPDLITRQNMESIFGNSSLILLTKPGSFSVAGFEEASQLDQAFRDKDQIKDVLSVFNQKYLDSQGGSFEVDSLIPALPQNSNELSESRDRVRQDPSYLGNLVSPDLQSLNLILEFQSGISPAEMRELVLNTLSDSDKMGWTLSGYPVSNAVMKEYMDRDLQLLLPLVILLIMAVLYYSFQNFIGVLLPLLNISIATLLAMALLAWTGITLNVVSNSIPVLLMAIGSSYGIHFLTTYFQKLDPKIPHPETLRQTLKDVFPTISIAALTTMAGFLSNGFSPVKPIREFGFVTAFGVFGAALGALLFMPSCLQILYKLRPQWIYRVQENPRVRDSRLSFIASLSARRPVLILCVGMSILLCLGVSSTKMNSSYHILGYFLEDSQILKDAKQVAEEFGGLSDFNVVFKSESPEGILHPKVLSAADNLEKQLKAVPNNEIKVTSSLSGAIKRMSEALNGGEKYYRIPTSKAEVLQYLEVYSWSSDPSVDLRTLTDPDYRFLRVYGRFDLITQDGNKVDRSIQHYKSVIQAEIDKIRDEVPLGVEVFQYGDIPMWNSALKNIVEGQVYAVGVATLIVFLILLGVLKSFQLAVIGILPVAFAVTGVYGVMGAFEIPLDIATSLVSAMAIGIGIDDALHFLLNYQLKSRDGAPTSFAIQETIASTGKAIVFTSIALILGFSMFFLSQFKPMIYFATLNIVAIALATASTLFLVPAMLSIFDRRRPKNV